MSPKISVIVPVYNTEAFLRQCLQSIINQTYKNLEVIVINDGSSDSSESIINEFKNIDNRIIYINKINTGLSDTRNSGITKSTGQYLMFVDSDDWLEENIISSLHANIGKCDLIACGYTREFKNMSLPRFYGTSGEFISYDFKSLLICPYINNRIDPSALDVLSPVWGKLYRASIIKENNIKFISTSIIGTAEDLLFNIQYINFASKAKLIDLPLYHYRKFNSSSFTSIYKSDLVIKHQNLFKELGCAIGQDIRHMSLLESRRAISTIGLGLNAISNPASFFDIHKSLSEILNSDKYSNSYRILSLSSLSMPWRIFFYFARHKITTGLFILLKIIKAIINRGN